MSAKSSNACLRASCTVCESVQSASQQHSFELLAIHVHPSPFILISAFCICLKSCRTGYTENQPKHFHHHLVLKLLCLNSNQVNGLICVTFQLLQNDVTYSCLVNSLQMTTLNKLGSFSGEYCFAAFIALKFN